MLIKNIQELTAWPSKDGCRIKEIIHPGQTGTDLGVSLAWAEVPPGGSTVPHRLAMTEIYFVLEGRGVMHINGQEAEVGPGQAVYIPRQRTQFIKNIGPGPLRFLCVCHPAYDPEGDEVVAAP